MRRRLAHGVFVFICGGVAALLGVASALLYSPAGNALLARLLTDQAPRLVRGTLQVGAVGGRWLGGFHLDRVVIRDTSGVLLAEVPRLEVSYRLSDFFARRIVLSSAVLHHPTIQIIKHRNGRVNHEEIFRLNEGPAGTGRGTLFQISKLVIDSGLVTIRLPWNPDGRLKVKAQIDSALAFERAKPGRRIEPGSEGLEMIRTIADLETEMPLVRLSTPDHRPVTIRIGRLSARLSDPAIEIRDLRAELRSKDDSLLFDIARMELPGTSGTGEGRIDWPRDTILYHFRLDAPKLALADLRWVSPDFPDFTGSASVQAQSVSGSRTEYDIRDLVLGDPSTRVTGRMIALTDIFRGLGFRALGVEFSNLDLDVVRPYLDTLPFHGRLTGHLGADGFFDGMTVSLDWLFRDAGVIGGAESRLTLDGPLRLGGAEGMIFQDARLEQSDADLRTIRLVAPAVILEGRLGLSGTLNGPWKNVVFAGAIEHRDGERRPSHLNGTARLDTRGAIVGLETDLFLDSLSFDGIRRSFPTLSARGALGGRVKLSGTLDHLAIDADVSGAVGRIEALGHATLLPPRWAADSLRLRLSRLNLDALTGGAAPVSALNGVVHVTGTADSAVAPVGRLVASLGAGRIREFAFDSAAVQLHATDSLITLDTLTVGWDGGWLVGGGAIGFALPHTGRITLHADARDLAAFDSLARGLTGFGRDPTGAESELSGRGSAGATIEGALGALRIDGTARIDSLRWLQYRVQGIQGRLQLATLDTTLDASLTIDSLRAHHLAFSQVRGLVRGHPDSLAWLAFGRGSALARFGAGGWSTRHLGERVFHADSVNLDLLRGEWRLAAPFSVRVRDSLIGLDSVRFITRDGSGSIEVAGDIPRTAPGNLSLTALGIELRDLYGLAQRDTTGLSGTLAMDARLGGTSTAPEFRGTAALSGAVFGDFQAPLIRAAFDYRQRLLRSNLTFWRTGEPFVQVDASLPLELSLQTVARRQLPGALTIVATGDSIDLAIAEAFTPNLRHVSGILDVDARVEGSWDAPRLAGTIRLTGGAAEVPSLGVRYGPVAGRLRLTGDSLIAEGMTVASRTGSLNITGGIRLERLTQPLLGLDLSARDFELINVPNYLKLQSWGDVSLRGPLLHPVLTGSGRLSNSVIYFADLVSKDIVNLEDPMNADLVDTLALRVQDLGANFQSRFLDSLSIRNLDFIAGEGVWLRSNEANFQLEGRVRVNKTRRLYRMDGSFDTPRGTYNFNIGGLINRTFTVERGTVHYFGDLNAELDVSARHVVKTPQGSGSDVPVIAHITGTLQVPKLSLATPPDRPGLTEPQLISLLMLGTTNPAAAGQLGTASQTRSAFGAVALTGLSSELQRALISDLGAPLDIVEIRPGLATSGFVGGTASTTQLAVGRAITSKLFVTANAGFCFSAGQSAFNARNLGASLEYRFRRELRFLLSAEPLQTCFATGADAFTSAKRYQFGAELRWDRDY